MYLHSHTLAVELHLAWKFSIASHCWLECLKGVSLDLDVGGGGGLGLRAWSVKSPDYSNSRFNKFKRSRDAAKWLTSFFSSTSVISNYVNEVLNVSRPSLASFTSIWYGLSWGVRSLETSYAVCLAIVQAHGASSVSSSPSWKSVVRSFKMNDLDSFSSVEATNTSPRISKTLKRDHHQQISPVSTKVSPKINVHVSLQFPPILQGLAFVILDLLHHYHNARHLLEQEVAADQSPLLINQRKW